MELSELLALVSFDDLRQYFEDNKIPHPQTSTKEAYIAALEDAGDYTRDLRVAVLLQLKNTSTALAKEIRTSSDRLQTVSTDLSTKVQAVSAELSTKVAEVSNLQSVIKYSGAVLSIVIGIAAFFGVQKLSELDTKVAQAGVQLEAGKELVGTYREYMIRILSEDVGTLMGSVSTRWLSDAMRPIQDLVASDMVTVTHLLSIESKAGAPPGTSELRLLKAQLDAIEEVSRVFGTMGDSAPPKVDERVRGRIEQRWHLLDQSLSSSGTTDPALKARLEMYEAYVWNVLGVVHYDRSKASRAANESGDAELNLAEEYFRKAKKQAPAFSPAASNLAVVLLDKIDLRSAGQSALPVKEDDFNEAEELLRTASSLEQSPKSLSRIYNNLAYSSLQRAFLLVNANNQKEAVRSIDKGLDWSSKAMLQNGFAPVAAATKGELLAYRACNTKRDLSAGDKQLISDALKIATERLYVFEGGTEQQFLEKSPALRCFMTTFPAERETILGSVRFSA